ncbi:MAG: hypothetical protein ACO1N0_12665 [Fluviicola sp.]
MMKKNNSLLISCFILLISSCTNSNQPNQEKELIKKEIQLVKNYESVELPYGNELIISKFPVLEDGADYDQKEIDLLDDEESELNQFYSNLFNIKGTSTNYLFETKNTLDYHLQYIENINSKKFNHDTYKIIAELPNKESFQVYIVRSQNANKHLYAIDNIIDLVVVKNNEILSSQNISMRTTSELGYESYFGDVYKYFFIDKNYTVHLKYFHVRTDQVSAAFAHTQFKINAEGKIIPYFDKTSKLQKYIEEGEMVNQTKSGKWKELFAGFEGEHSLRATALVTYEKGVKLPNVDIYKYEEPANGKIVITDPSIKNIQLKTRNKLLQ